MFATDDIPHTLLLSVHMGEGGAANLKVNSMTFPDPERLGPHLFNLPV